MLGDDLVRLGEALLVICAVFVADSPPLESERQIALPHLVDEQSLTDPFRLLHERMRAEVGIRGRRMNGAARAMSNGR